MLDPYHLEKLIARNFPTSVQAAPYEGEVETLSELSEAPTDNASRCAGGATIMVFDFKHVSAIVLRIFLGGITNFHKYLGDIYVTHLV